MWRECAGKRTLYSARKGLVIPPARHLTNLFLWVFLSEKFFEKEPDVSRVLGSVTVSQV
jgi:hypothetical protein